MKVAVFDTHHFERPYFDEANSRFGHSLVYFEPRLTEETASLCTGFPAVCVFTNDKLNAEVQERLRNGGSRLIALRSAGFNHVDLDAAARLGMKVVRVPAYSPYAVAEHAVALMLGLNRKICRAAARVRELNFSLDGLVGFDLNQKTVGIIGTGRIGSVLARIMTGFGCTILAFDPKPDPELARTLGVRYVSLEDLYRGSDIISLHVPLTAATHHMIDRKSLAMLKPGVMLINTGRGALIDTRDLISALKTGQVGAAGLDVYEEEENIFFRDLSDQVLQDDLLARLLTFPNVLVTSHQAFLTQEALSHIADTTLRNIQDFEQGKALINEVRAETHVADVRASAS